MIQLEIPYNFDKKLIDFLRIYDPQGMMIQCIYIAPYYKDYIGTRKYYNCKNNINSALSKNPLNREEYINHILYIQKFYPKKIMLLLQQNDNCIDSKFLNFYFSLGINKFCCGNIKQAQEIKEKNNNVELTASITMKLSANQIKNDKNLEIFNNIVLHFSYNRNLNLIKSLPSKYKYILLSNSDCSVECDGTHHWFAGVDKDGNEDCKYCPKEQFKDKWNKSTFIRPEDLILFQPYISYFKLQGREDYTSDIIRSIVLYSTFNKFDVLYTEEKYNTFE